MIACLSRLSVKDISAKQKHRVDGVLLREKPTSSGT